ncbi:histidine phosphatase family protein [Candidatus Kapabacteria bacterium]|nr:histidine phosphatase family protein [Candidatus Kapabacteria bacterium]
MKKLLLNRHAKSDWGNQSISDFDRPLNKRGLKDAPEMAGRLLNRKIIPDIILSSPALRAITTAKFFSEQYSLEPIEEENIYSNGMQCLRKILPKLDNKFSTVLCFGHNPDFTSLATFYSGEVFSNIPTCGIVCIEFDTETWENIDQLNGKLIFFDYPKSIND